jgi:hypothetical protein
VGGSFFLYAPSGLKKGKNSSKGLGLMEEKDNKTATPKEDTPNETSSEKELVKIRSKKLRGRWCTTWKSKRSNLPRSFTSAKRPSSGSP